MVLQMQSVDKIRLSNCVRMLPEEMKFENAMQGIKFARRKSETKQLVRPIYFALSPNKNGVQQIIHDEFSAARDYEKMWNEYKDGTSLSPRRDLET